MSLRAIEYTLYAVIVGCVATVVVIVYRFALTQFAEFQNMPSPATQAVNHAYRLPPSPPAPPSAPPAASHPPAS